MKAASFRSLNLLAAHASTARVLNLREAQARRGSDERPEQPLFQSSVLDQALIVKHRLRPDEQERLDIGRATATKVLMPLDRCDLGVGAASVFVGEPNWRARLSNYALLDGLKDRGERDVAVLSLLDTLPSLDPFLLREKLARNGFAVDSSYFSISAADVQRMSDYVRTAILPLVRLCVGEASQDQTERLVRKLLSAELDDSMQLLRQTLQLPPDLFEEGMFCWKGLLYYKWVIATQMELACGVAKTIAHQTWAGAATLEEKAYLGVARKRLAVSITRSVSLVGRALREYDGAFKQLTEAADPLAFRDFLLNAPTVFAQTGEQLGALQHIVSYWNFHYAAMREEAITADLLCDILRDFEASLGLKSEEALGFGADTGGRAAASSHRSAPSHKPGGTAMAPASVAAPA